MYYVEQTVDPEKAEASPALSMMREMDCMTSCSNEAAVFSDDDELKSIALDTVKALEKVKKRLQDWIAAKATETAATETE